ncbi:hypothetical protein [Gimesia aquarii]|uniref:Nickel uptake substrate-specific transmembrane region n=1 Tax=Gimesia aquarii TaxID=2527964 RepID=A0A517WYQ0_9PLAN|nr:hypothetical protein [Gimesia aquarii]QDU10382.1 hypothetical protein V202x_37810 [Gimesia aquarii]
MKTTLCLIAIILITGVANAQEKAPEILPVTKSKDLIIRDAKVSLLEDLDLLVFEIATQGKPGNTVPTPRGTMAGAPVLGYVFPTTLKASDVGLSETDGTVALAVTSHPDFDDTPLWDENNDRQFKNDGVVFHTHWVVLKQDTRVKGGLAVKQITGSEKKRVKLPPTNPGMPMYMDSPGLTVVIKDDTLRVLVPLWRVNHQKDFKFDAVAAYMQVMPSGDYPLLGVYEVYSVWSGNLSLPGRVQQVCR